MRSINIETIMGHSIGISDSYYRVTENELLEDYLKAVNYLTISNEHTLQREISVVMEQSENKYNSLKSELYNKEKEIRSLEERDRQNDKEMLIIKEQVRSIMKSLRILKPEDKIKVATDLIEKGMYEQLKK